MVLLYTLVLGIWYYSKFLNYFILLYCVTFHYITGLKFNILLHRIYWIVFYYAAFHFFLFYYLHYPILDITTPCILYCIPLYWISSHFNVLHTIYYITKRNVWTPTFHPITFHGAFYQFTAHPITCRCKKQQKMKNTPRRKRLLKVKWAFSGAKEIKRVEYYYSPKK